ncbi:hypothetical protein HSRCO_0699 [Halanaeroarchaeum sp. HSR-CO]|uniref:hypothetical protein n=1 Tax=Halanaeroarchaeum sp. HSR-CO TaxID=2866382 RepID=UPI00217DC3DA|nr:hypothetical protein [Halanaeroarchaeum sp. HSR-CO]UWG46994.1 hypothetical protein HSRCO_0699 [Halanaeroarchaeum sp. HSR-CO]
MLGSALAESVERPWAINPWIQFLWISLAGVFGGFLGWFNIQITFPTAEGSGVEKAPWEWFGIVATVVIAVLLFARYHPWTSLMQGTPTQFAAFVVVIAAVVLGVGGQAIRTAS